MVGGELSMNWDRLVPHIEHPTRKSIVEALRWTGPLSVADLKSVRDDAKCHLAHVSYHVAVLVEAEVIAEYGQRRAGKLNEKIYSLCPQS